MVPVQKCKTDTTRCSASLFAAYYRIHKADLLRATDRQFALAEELDHVRHALKRLAELAKNVATIVTYDLYVQNSTAASEPHNTTTCHFKDWLGQGLMYHSTHFTSFRRRWGDYGISQDYSRSQPYSVCGVE